jgi:hypothetical protein
MESSIADLYAESEALVNTMCIAETLGKSIFLGSVQKAASRGPIHDTEQSESQSQFVPIMCQLLDQCIAHNDLNQVYL